jgi:tetratricopeptide (TPR) repeat protein
LKYYPNEPNFSLAASTVNSSIKLRVIDFSMLSLLQKRPFVFPILYILIFNFWYFVVYSMKRRFYVGDWKLKGETMLRRVLICLVVLVVSTSAFAQEEGLQVIDSGATFHGELARGHELYKSQDFEGAYQAYEAAKDKAPGSPIAYYFLGCTQVRLARYDDASVTLRAVTTMAGDKNQSLHAKALFMIAIVEEMRVKLDSAKEAWNAYKAYVEPRKDAISYIGTAVARIDAIDKKLALDEKYKVVQDRLAASK